MKYAKSGSGSGSSGAGLVGLHTDYGTYQRWLRTSSERIKFLMATYKLTNMADEHYANNQHRDFSSTEKYRSEKRRYKNCRYHL